MGFGFIISFITSQLWRAKELWSSLVVQRLRSEHSSGPGLIDAAKISTGEEIEPKTELELPDFDLYCFQDEVDIPKIETGNGHYVTENYVDRGFTEPSDEIGSWWHDQVLLSTANHPRFVHRYSNFEQTISSVSDDILEIKHFLDVVLALIVILFIKKFIKYVNQREVSSEVQAHTEPTTEITSIVKADESIRYDDFSFATAFDSFGPSIPVFSYTSPSMLDAEFGRLSFDSSIKLSTRGSQEPYEDYQSTNDENFGAIMGDDDNHNDDALKELENQFDRNGPESGYPFDDELNQEGIREAMLDLDLIAELNYDNDNDAATKRAAEDDFTNQAFFISEGGAAAFGEYMDELVHRRRLVDLLPSSDGSFSSEEVNQKSPSISSTNSSIDMTSLSVEIAQLFDNELEQDHKSPNQSAIEKYFGNSEDEFMDAPPSETGTNSKRSGAEIVVKNANSVNEVYDHERRKSISHTETSMDGIIESFSPDGSSLDEKIEFFEVLSGTDQKPITPLTSPIEDLHPMAIDIPPKSQDEIEFSHTTPKKYNVENGIGHSVSKQINISTNESMFKSAPRKQSTWKAVFESSPAIKKELDSALEPKMPSINTQNIKQSKMRSPRPRSQNHASFNISEKVVEYLLAKDKPNIDGYLINLFGDDPMITINENLLEALSKENIDTLIAVYKGKETSENWKERFDSFDLLIGHLRLHEPQCLYSYFEEKIYDVIEDILEMVSTSRSKLQEKVILFIREIVYYGDSFTLNDESFVSLIHLLIPLTRSTSNFICRLVLKSLCLMVQALDIPDFKRIFHLMCSGIISNRKLKAEKYACLFMIKFYLAANYKKLTQGDAEDIVEMIVPYVSYLAIDSFQKTRSEVVDIYLIFERKIPESPNIVKFYEGFSTFLRSKLKKPQSLS